MDCHKLFSMFSLVSKCCSIQSPLILDYFGSQVANFQVLGHDGQYPIREDIRYLIKFTRKTYWLHLLLAFTF